MWSASLVPMGLLNEPEKKQLPHMDFMKDILEPLNESE